MKCPTQPLSLRASSDSNSVYFSPDKVNKYTFEEAIDLCHDNGGYLPSIANPSEKLSFKMEVLKHSVGKMETRLNKHKWSSTLLEGGGANF